MRFDYWNIRNYFTVETKPNPHGYILSSEQNTNITNSELIKTEQGMKNMK